MNWKLTVLTVHFQPDGNLFKDRFIGLQRRNIIEPRVRVVRSRKYKQKFFEKPSYRFLS